MTTETTPNMHRILNGLPMGVKTSRLLPLDAALALVVPMLEKNDPLRASAIPLFETWIKDRDESLSVDQTVWLWENFTAQFVRELPARLSQWLYAPLSGDRKNPVSLARDLIDSWVGMTYRPWKAKKTATPLGRMQVKAVELLPPIATFIVALPLFTMLYSALFEWRDPVIAALKQLTSF